MKQHEPKGPLTLGFAHGLEPDGDAHHDQHNLGVPAQVVVSWRITAAIWQRRLAQECSRLRAAAACAEQACQLSCRLPTSLSRASTECASSRTETTRRAHRRGECASRSLLSFAPYGAALALIFGPNRKSAKDCPSGLARGGGVWSSLEGECIYRHHRRAQRGASFSALRIT